MLLEWGRGAGAGDKTTARRLKTNHGIGVRAEAAYTALVERRRIAFYRVPNVRTGTSHYLVCEGITGLNLGDGEHIVDQASLSLCGRRRTGPTRSQSVKSVRISLCWIG